MIKQIIIALVALLLIIGCQKQSKEVLDKPAGPMTLERLGEIITESTENVNAQGTYFEFTLAGVSMACVTDPGSDRMRIVAPIIPTSQLTDQQRKAMLEANFHSALDGRYAISNGIVYAAFIHPLSALHEPEVKSALFQVSQLALSFGTTYSSGILSFGQQGTDI